VQCQEPALTGDLQGKEMTLYMTSCHLKLSDSWSPSDRHISLWLPAEVKVTRPLGSSRQLTVVRVQFLVPLFWVPWLFNRQHGNTAMLAIHISSYILNATFLTFDVDLRTTSQTPQNVYQKQLQSLLLDPFFTHCS